MPNNKKKKLAATIFIYIDRSGNFSHPDDLLIENKYTEFADCVIRDMCENIEWEHECELAMEAL